MTERGWVSASDLILRESVMTGGRITGARITRENKDRERDHSGTMTPAPGAASYLCNLMAGESDGAENKL